MTSSKKCPRCGLVNFSDAEACKRCGNDLTAQSEPPPPAPKLFPCPDCGKEISTSAAMCIHCGRPLQASAPVAVRVAPARRAGLNFEAAGTTMVIFGVLLSCGGLSAGITGIGALGMLLLGVGFVVFIVGRFM